MQSARILAMVVGVSSAMTRSSEVGGRRNLFRPMSGKSVNRPTSIQSSKSLHKRRPRLKSDLAARHSDRKFSNR